MNLVENKSAHGGDIENDPYGVKQAALSKVNSKNKGTKSLA